MRRSTLTGALCLGVALAGIAALAQETLDRCVAEYDRCLRACDKERWWFLFRGEAYERCVDTCERRLHRCEAEEDDTTRKARGKDEPQEEPPAPRRAP